MGADMTITWATFPVTTDGKRVDLKDLPALCAERIAAYVPHPRPGDSGSSYWGSPEHWREQLERVILNDELDVGDLTYEPSDSVEDLSPDELALVRQLLAQDVAALTTIGRGELAPVTIKGTTYLFTGGPSWGDPPTDIFDSIDRIDVAGLFDEPFPRGTES